MAEGAANLVLRELKIEDLRVNPIEIANQKGITVQSKPGTAAGVSGMLIKAGDEFGILYATNIPSKGFQNFSIAHELGHYCIDGHSDALLSSGVHVSHAGFVSDDPFEQEADYFAAALLMPERPFRKELERHESGLTCVQALRKACETSLTATAIRYTNVTPDGVAVIVSTGAKIDYCFMSDGWKQAKGISWLKTGTPVPQGTVTAAFNALPDNIRLGKTDSGAGRLNDWMGGDRTYSIAEEVVGLGQYGRTLTILTCDALALDAGEDEEENDEQLVESWTPKFR
jgi:Zn-dependent peptidase ImmA (M78 family)